MTWIIGVVVVLLILGVSVGVREWQLQEELIKMARWSATNEASKRESKE